MLKIHRSGNGEVVLTLSGRMDHESTVELENVIEAEMKGHQIVLDIKDLTLVGQSDIDFLARCEAAGIKLVNCARYVREWIARQQGGKSRHNRLIKGPKSVQRECDRTGVFAECVGARKMSVRDSTYGAGQEDASPFRLMS